MERGQEIQTLDSQLVVTPNTSGEHEPACVGPTGNGAAAAAERPLLPEQQALLSAL